MSILSKLLGEKSNSQKVKINRPPILYSETQGLIQQIIAQQEADFIAYWGANNSSMSSNDVVVFHELLKSNPKQSDTLYLFVKSNGGSGKVALRIINLLRSKYQKIIVLAPINCASAATMLALGADEIHMGPLSFLTAVDTSITHDLSPVDTDGDLVSVSQNALDRVIKLWSNEKTEKDKNAYVELYKYIHPLVFGAVDRARSLAINLTNDILSYHMQDKDAISRISEHLNGFYPSHDYPITFQEAKSLGLNIYPLDQSINDQLIELNLLYSRMAQRSYTDYDAYSYHDNQVLTIIETAETMIYYQREKDYYFRKENNESVPMNDFSSWRKVTPAGREIFHIR